MSVIDTEDVGGIRIAKRTIPAWLIVVGFTIMTIAAWYLLSYSSTDYYGSYPKPPQVVEDGGGER